MINGPGQVVFIAGDGKGDTLLQLSQKKPDGSVNTVTLANTAGGFFRTINDYPILNDKGTVLFPAEINPLSSGIYALLPGGSLVRVAQVNTPYQGGGAFNGFFGTRQADVNNAGEVAFGASFNDAKGDRQNGLFFGTSLPDPKGMGVPLPPAALPQLAAAVDDKRFGTQSPSLNNKGAFEYLTTENGGKLSQLSGVLALSAGNNGDTFASLGDPSLNQLGQVAFSATLPGGDLGIFKGPNSKADRVIGLGDPLLGSTVEGLLYGSHALNDRGQLAFEADLMDGRQVIVLATPTPEPAGLILTATGMLCLLGCGWGRCQRRRPE
jgi:hypothetical protein